MRSIENSRAKNWEQFGNNLITKEKFNWEQTGNKLGTKWVPKWEQILEQSGNKLGTKVAMELGTNLEKTREHSNEPFYFLCLTKTQQKIVYFATKSAKARGVKRHRIDL